MFGLRRNDVCRFHYLLELFEKFCVLENVTSSKKLCYYSQNGERTAELNYTNPTIRENLKQVLKYWSNVGVKSFLLNDVEYLIENNYDKNEIQTGFTETDNFYPCNGRYRYCRVPHHFSRDTRETIEYLHELRNFVHSFEGYIIVRLDHVTFASRSSMKYLELYMNQTYQATDYVILSPFSSFYSQPDKYDKAIKLISEAKGSSRTILWESTDISRNVARVQSRVQYPLNVQLLAMSYMFPGSPVLLYGDEFGLQGMLRKNEKKNLTQFEKFPVSKYQR